MKYIYAIVLSFFAFTLTAQAATITYSGGSGSTIIKVGMVFATSTLSNAISVVDANNNPVNMNGVTANMWNAVSQSWNTSTFNNGWSTDFTLLTGDGLMIDTGTTTHKVILTGDTFTGSVQITVRPGLNLLASNVNGNIASTGIFSPIDGDQVTAYQSVTSNYNGGTLSTFDTLTNDWQTVTPSVHFGVAFWYDSATSTVRSWTATF